ncbi:alpha/beta hydrolase [Pseudoalteromonas sp. GB56]
MKFSFFNESSGHKLGLTSVTRGLTSVLSKLAPRLSASVGNRILLQPRGKREYDFKDFPSHREMNIMTSIGVAHVNLFGSGDKLVVISHGWADNSYSFQRMIRSLIEQGYLVAALDHIGHGKSSGNKSHLLSFIETMELLLGKFAEERLHVEAIIGHSMGAYATLNLPHQLLEDKKIIFDLLSRTVLSINVQ